VFIFVMQLHEYQIPLKYGTWRQGIILQNGDCFGDVAPLPGFSQETFEEAKAETHHVIKTGAIPKLPSVQFAFACVEIPFPNYIEVPVAALDREGPGFEAVKLKLGHLCLEDAIALVKQTNVKEIRLDFNQKWSLEKLLRFADHFSPEHFTYLEEPTKEFADLVIFAKLTGMPIAVDESIPTTPYWEISTLKAVVVKPTILGKIPYLPPNTELIFSSAYESGIGLLHIAKLAQEHNPNRPHGLDSYSSLLADVIDPRPVIEKGMLLWNGPLSFLSNGAAAINNIHIAQ
jgi:O-succinylbenzoate synthase